MSTNIEAPRRTLAESERGDTVHATQTGVEVGDQAGLVAGHSRKFLSEVQSHIDAALKKSPGADGQSIRVTVRGVDVTLTGTVHNWSERQLAAHSAWVTPGVRNVVDDISVAW